MAHKMVRQNIKRFLLSRRNKETHSAIAYLRNIGGGLSVIGVVGVFPFPQFYWWFVGCIYLGLFLLAVEAFLENWTLISRVAVALTWIALAVLYTFQVVLAPAPFNVVVVGRNGDYRDSAGKIADVQWSDDYYEVDVSIVDPTDTPYTDIDLLLTSDLPIAEIGQTTKNQTVTITPVIVDATEAESDKDGHILRSGPLEIHSINQWRLQCDRIPKRDRLGFVLAVVNPDKQHPGRRLPKRSPDHIWLIGDYISRGERPRKTDRKYPVMQQP